MDVQNPVGDPKFVGKVWAAVMVQARVDGIQFPTTRGPSPSAFNVIPGLFYVPDGAAPETICVPDGVIPGVTCSYIRPASEAETELFYEQNPDKRPAELPAVFTSV